MLYADGCWFFAAAGSGVFINIGRSLRYRTRQAAAKALGPPDPVGAKRDGTWCTTARARGYDSVQVQTDLPGSTFMYVKHASRQTRALVELVVCHDDCATKPACDACPPMELRTGVSASRPCACEHGMGFIQCGTLNASDAPCDRLHVRHHPPPAPARAPSGVHPLLAPLALAALGATAPRLVQHMRHALHAASHSWKRAPLYASALDSPLDACAATPHQTAGVYPAAPAHSAATPTSEDEVVDSAFDGPLILMSDTRPLVRGSYWAEAAAAASLYALRHGYAFAYMQQCGLDGDASSARTKDGDTSSRSSGGGGHNSSLDAAPLGTSSLPSNTASNAASDTASITWTNVPRADRRGAVWRRFVLVRAALATGFEAALLLDSDTIIHAPPVGLDGLLRIPTIPRIAGKSLGMGKPTDASVGAIGASNAPWMSHQPCAGNTLWRRNANGLALLAALWRDTSAEHAAVHHARARTEAEMHALWSILRANRTLSNAFATLQAPQFYMSRGLQSLIATHQHKHLRCCGCDVNLPWDRESRFFCHASHFGANASVRAEYLRSAQAKAMQLNVSWFAFGRPARAANHSSTSNASSHGRMPSEVAHLAPRCARSHHMEWRQCSHGRWQAFGVDAGDVADAAAVLFGVE